MAHISINTGGLINARVQKVPFALTERELNHINLKLTELEGKIPDNASIDLIISKSEKEYKGTMKIEELNLYCFAKGESVAILFSRLILKMIIEINQYKKNYRRLKSVFPKEIYLF